MADVLGCVDLLAFNQSYSTLSTTSPNHTIHATLEHIESRLPLGYEYLGEQTVKKIAKPVGAYRLLMEPEAAGKAKTETMALVSFSSSGGPPSSETTSFVPRLVPHKYLVPKFISTSYQPGVMI